MVGASVPSSPVALHSLPSLPASFNLKPPLLRLPAHPPPPQRLRRFHCRPNPPGQIDSPSKEEQQIVKDETSQIENPSSNTEVTMFPDKTINRRISLASSVAAFGLFFSSRLEFGVSLRDVAANAVPYDEALANGMPTVLEFYADWCEVCKELAPDVYKVEQQYKGRVNFVMLNVDNTKWEQELDEFGVEGIPHFAFLDREGNEEGSVVGRLPKKNLLENVAALVNGVASIPHARVVGQYSSADGRKIHRVVDPRSHG